MTMCDLSGEQTMALILGLILGVSPEESLEALDRVMLEAEERLIPMTDEHHAKFKHWLSRLVTDDLNDWSQIIMEVEALHKAPDTHDYKGLCERIQDFGQVVAEVGVFRFGDDYAEMVKRLEASLT